MKKRYWIAGTATAAATIAVAAKLLARPRDAVERPARDDLGREHRKFSDYWRGNGKRKIDWDATWRNWMRRAWESLPPSSKNTPASGTGSAAAPWKAPEIKE